MFYSRPKIEPLGWDLTDLPTRNGSKHFDAFTSDQRPVDFRFGGGWLSVEIGPPGAPLEGPDMKELLAIRIAPFGTMEIEPEQICYILGLTVNGHKIDSAGIAIGARGYDWSGCTTYWESTHLMQPRDDARMFIQKLRDAFPDSILVQPQWGDGGRLRCRQIQFLMTSDETIALGIDPNEVLFKKLVSGDEVSTEHFESTFAYRVDFSHRQGVGEDVTGSLYVWNHGAKELGLEYSTIQHRHLRIRTQYLTDDADAQARTKTLLSVIDASFRRGLRVVNLQTGAVMTENLRDDQDKRSYSVALRDEWLSKPDRYLFVGQTLRDDEFAGEGGVFYGARPIGA